MIDIEIIEQEEGGGRYCDYCSETKRKFVHQKNSDRDICFDCVLVIYDMAKNEVLR